MELHHSSEQEAPKKVTKLFLNMPLIAVVIHSRRGLRCGVYQSSPILFYSLLGVVFDPARCLANVNSRGGFQKGGLTFSTTLHSKARKSWPLRGKEMSTEPRLTQAALKCRF